jgi:hypothetical protein
MTNNPSISRWPLRFLVLAAGLQALWALSAITLRPVEFDEVSIVDTALHGGLESWRRILPQEVRVLSDQMSHATKGGHGQIIKWVCRNFGVGVLQVRIPQVIAGLASLWILLWIALRYRLPLLVGYGLIASGFSFPFFYILISARQESFVLLAACLQAAWLLGRQRSRWLSGIMGFVAMTSISFHPAALFIVLAVPMTFLGLYRRELDQRAAAVWWIVGMMIGLQVVFAVVDWDRALLYLYAAASPQAASAHPPLLRFWSSPLSLLFHPFDLLDRPDDIITTWYHAALGCLFAGVLCQWRRRRDLTVSEYGLLFFSTIIFLNWALLSCSETAAYLVYFLFLFLMEMLFFLHGVWTNRFRLDASDVIIFGVIQLLMHQNYMSYREMAGVSVILIGVLPGLLRLPWKVLRWAVFSAALVFLHAPDFPVILLTYLKLNFYQHPLLTSAIIGLIGVLCYLISAPDTEGNHWVRAKPRLFGALVISVWILHIGMDRAPLGSSRPTARMPEPTQGPWASYRAERRLVGPQILVIDEPSMALQAIEALTVSRQYYGLRIDYVVKSLAAYRPSLIVCSQYEWQELRRFITNHPAYFESVICEPDIITPQAAYIPVRIRFNRKAVQRSGRDFGVLAVSPQRP